MIFKFIFKAEKDHFLYPLLDDINLIKEEIIIKRYIEKYINNFDFNLINAIERINSNQITLFMNLLLPLSKKWYDLINVFIENNIKEKYLRIEDHIRLSNDIEERLMKEINIYESKKQDLINNTKGEILRIEGLNDLIKSNNIKYIKLLFQDFFKIFLNKKFNDHLELGLQFLDHDISK